MAHWTFAIKNLGNKESAPVRQGGSIVADAYNSEVSESIRRNLLANCGKENPIVMIDGAEIDSRLSLA